MAIHNQARMIGYLLKDPAIQNEGNIESERALITIRTCHRQVDGYYERLFEDIIIFCDDKKLMPTIKALRRYDIIDVKGVVNILRTTKRTTCPYCGKQNISYAKPSTFIYPISMYKLQTLKSAVESGDYDEENLVFWLQEKYMENSNQVLLMGTVTTQPEMIGSERHPCCRFGLGINRKYYIASQSDITADYPWVYSYAQQATSDSIHLQVGAEVMVDGIMRNESIKPAVKCEHCEAVYRYQDVRASFVPYSLEYLSKYLTDEDLRRIREEKQRKALMGISG